MEKLLTPSPDRCAARCTLFGTCGGCVWQDLSYEAQLKYKASQVRESLEHLGGLQGLRAPSDPGHGVPLALPQPGRLLHRHERRRRRGGLSSARQLGPSPAAHRVSPARLRHRGRACDRGGLAAETRASPAGTRAPVKASRATCWPARAKVGRSSSSAWSRPCRTARHRGPGRAPARVRIPNWWASPTRSTAAAPSSVPASPSPCSGDGPTCSRSSPA